MEQVGKAIIIEDDPLQKQDEALRLLNKLLAGFQVMRIFMGDGIKDYEKNAVGIWLDGVENDLSEIKGIVKSMC